MVGAVIGNLLPNMLPIKSTLKHQLDIRLIEEAVANRTWLAIPLCPNITIPEWPRFSPYLSIPDCNCLDFKCNCLDIQCNCPDLQYHCPDVIAWHVPAWIVIRRSPSWASTMGCCRLGHRHWLTWPSGLPRTCHSPIAHCCLNPNRGSRTQQCRGFVEFLWLLLFPWLLQKSTVGAQVSGQCCPSCISGEEVWRVGVLNLDFYFVSWRTTKRGQ